MTKEEIYTPKMPMAQSLDLPSHLYQGDVNELGFEYLLEVDGINVELEDTEEDCREYIRQHLAALRAEEIIAYISLCLQRYEGMGY